METLIAAYLIAQILQVKMKTVQSSIRKKKIWSIDERLIQQFQQLQN